MFIIYFLFFTYKLHKENNLPVFFTASFVNFAGHPEPTMNVIKAIVLLVTLSSIKPPHNNYCPPVSESIPDD